MGLCKYCGEDAGIFSHVHKECEEKHIHQQSVSTNTPRILTGLSILINWI